MNNKYFRGFKVLKVLLKEIILMLLVIKQKRLKKIRIWIQNALLNQK